MCLPLSTTLPQHSSPLRSATDCVQNQPQKPDHPASWPAISPQTPSQATNHTAQDPPPPHPTPWRAETACASGAGRSWNCRTSARWRVRWGSTRGRCLASLGWAGLSGDVDQCKGEANGENISTCVSGEMHKYHCGEIDPWVRAGLERNLLDCALRSIHKTCSGNRSDFISSLGPSFWWPYIASEHDPCALGQQDLLLQAHIIRRSLLRRQIIVLRLAAQHRLPGARELTAIELWRKLARAQEIQNIRVKLELFFGGGDVPEARGEEVVVLFRGGVCAKAR